LQAAIEPSDSTPMKIGGSEGILTPTSSLKRRECYHYITDP
jgi:hypothetical protein